MNKYNVVGPIKIPAEQGHRGPIITETTAKKFWNNRDADRIRDERGCYIFGIKARRGAMPYYVGRTTKKSFESECFTDHKINKYHKAISRTTMGYPIMFFIVHPIRQGKTNSRQIGGIENFLIKLEVSRNEKHLNVKNSNVIDDWRISGVTGGRKPSVSAKKLKKMMGMDN